MCVCGVRKENPCGNIVKLRASILVIPTIRLGPSRRVGPCHIYIYTLMTCLCNGCSIVIERYININPEEVVAVNLLLCYGVKVGNGDRDISMCASL